MSNYRERLCRLAVNDPTLLAGELGVHRELPGADDRLFAIARLASLVAVHGSGPSFAEQTDAAIDAGLTPDEIVDVLFAVSSVVGLPRVVSAAPMVALALGFDVESVVD
ncbi:carboxymuconolactone decarboxylase family protein [Microbacterium lacus]|uniref:carboxymuconolactone decarboxylase family protein n=1 Tax=Microbacterium lacus TaxID=415217 RepID=UPI003850F5E7